MAFSPAGKLLNQPRLYVWTKTAEDILNSIARYCARINNSRH
jgi:hypothetical protein